MTTERTDEDLNRLGGAARDARPSLTALGRAADRAGTAFGAIIRGAPKSLGEFTDGITQLIGVGKPVSEAMKFAESYIGVWQGLTEYGVNFGNQLDEMIIQTGRANMRMEDLTRVVQASSRDLAGLGVTANQGIQGFLARQGQFYEQQITDYNGVQRRLLALGLTTDDINERFLQFEMMSTIRNRNEVLESSQRNQLAGEFAEEMDRLAKLTGQQADKLAKEQMELQRQGNIYAAQMELPASTQQQLITTIGRMNDFGESIGNVSTDILTRGFIDPNDPAALAIQSFGGDMIETLYAARAAMQRGDAAEARRLEGIAAEQAAALRTNRDFLQMARLGGATEFTRGIQRVVTELNTSGQALSQSNIRRRLSEEGLAETAENMSAMRERIIQEQRAAQTKPTESNAIINGYNELLIELQGLARGAQEPTVRAFTNIGNAAMEEIRTSIRGADIGAAVTSAISDTFGAFGLLNRGGQDFSASMQDVQSEFAAAARRADQQGNREEAVRLQRQAEEAARIRSDLMSGSISESEARSRITELGNAFSSTGPISITSSGRANVVIENLDSINGFNRGNTPEGGAAGNNIGTLGRTGSFFANFGPGTNVRLHGVEGVFRPNHIEEIMERSSRGTVQALVNDITNRGFSGSDIGAAELMGITRNITSSLDGRLNTLRATISSDIRETQTISPEMIGEQIRTAFASMPADMRRAFEDALSNTLKSPMEQLVSVSTRSTEYQERVYKNTRGISQDYLRGA